MKKRFCMAAAACLLLSTGCAESSYPPVFEPTANHTNPPETEETTAETLAETEPEAPQSELDRRLEAIAAAVPAEIPAEGWTDETLLPLVQICGEPVSMPFCVSELLFGYQPTGANSDFYSENAAEIFCNELDFSYAQCFVMSPESELELPEYEPRNPALPEDAHDYHIVLDAQYTVLSEGNAERYPVMVNCVTIGSTFDELVQQIGLSGEDRIPDADSDDPLPRFTVYCETESIRIMFMGSEDKVDTIMLHARDKEQ